MARALLMILGLAILALGIWLTIIWWDAVKIVLLALVALVLLLFGLALLIFGISEIASARGVPQPPLADAGGGEE